MVQQQNLYNAETGALGTLTSIEVQKALAQAYWFVNTPQDWSLKLTNGKTVVINNATPEAVIQQAVNGDLKPQGVYSAWDIKTAWEAAAIAILEQAPSHLDENIPTFANDFKGWIQATNWAIKAAGPDVTFGWQENVWNPGSANWLHADLTHAEVKSTITTPTSELWHNLQVYSGHYKPDFVVFDKFERDPIPAATKAGFTWNARDWDNGNTPIFKGVIK